jgi:hypothetical protein
VARARDLLERFRPSGAPGGATSAGVPVDRLATLGTELAPVFEELEPALQECARIRREAREQAQSREAAAGRRGHDIVARAQTESEAERADAAAAARSKVTRDTERTLGRVREQAEAVRQRGEQLRPRLVSRVVDLVRADLRGLAEDDGHGRADHWPGPGSGAGP